MEEKENKAQEQAPAAQQASAQAPRVRKFEIAVYNVNEEQDGKPQLQRVTYEQPVVIEATSPNDLQEKLNLYKQTGCVAKIVREIDPICSPAQMQPQPQQSMAPEASHFMQPTHPAAFSTSQAPVQQPVPRQKPRFFKVGDIDVKDDNGKIYQKQWMKLSDSEASNIRVINDKNNGIVNLTGKHIEMKRWVLVEDNENDDTTNLEESL